MQFSPGNIVRSTAGRDKNQLYVVVAITAKRVMVADGHKRTISAPKPKNCVHLQLVSQAGCVKTDDEIRHILQNTERKADEKGGELNGETGCHRS